jgi:hypothetical protein
MRAFFSMIILFLAGSIFNLTHCQTIYFNNLYHIGDPNTWSGANTLGMDEEGHVIWGKTGVNVGLIRLNFNGEQQWYKSWGDSIASWYAGWPGCLVSVNTEHYLAGSKNYYSPTNYDVGMVMKLNHDWDTVWTKEINMNLDDYPDTSTLINQLAICENGDLALVGGIYESSIGSKVLLMRTDTAGNILWYNLFSNSICDLNDGYSVIQTSDNGFAIGGDCYTPGTYLTGDPIIIKTDSLGNREWIKNLGGWYEDYVAMLCRSGDGNILMGTTIADTAIGNSPISRINVVKLDNDGNIIWNKKYGSSSLDNFLENIRCLEDGNIICTGSVMSAIPWNAGWILKLNPDGDSLWYRQYYYYSGYGSFNDLDDIIPTNDSGFLACGGLFPIPPDTGIQSAWGIKLDSIGCEWAGCDTTVGIKEHGGVEAWGHGGMEIWPNPAGELLHGRLNVDDGRLNIDFRLVIYDVFGREIYPKIISQGEEGWTVDISQLPTGMYIVICKDKENRISSGKFIKSLY